MSFSYRPIEDDDIQILESSGNIQSSLSDDLTFCPSKPLLRQWPYWIGLAQIAVGFLCAIFGCLEVFVIPLVMDLESGWSLDKSNSNGAALWSGFMLILAGSTAVRAAKFRQLLHVIQFYILTVFAFLFNLCMVIMQLWCSKLYNPSGKSSTYLKMSIVSVVWCLLGCLLLNLTFTRYFIPVVFEDVKLGLRIGLCLLPCFFKRVPSASSSRQSVNSTESNLIV